METSTAFFSDLKDKIITKEDIINIITSTTFFNFIAYRQSKHDLLFDDYVGNKLEIDLNKTYTVLSLFVLIKDVIHDIGKNKGSLEKTNQICNFFNNL